MAFSSRDNTHWRPLFSGGVSVNNGEVKRPAPERRSSFLTTEELKEAVEIRKKALKSPDVELGSIARTAPALSSSPERSVPVVTDADVRPLQSRTSLLLTTCLCRDQRFQVCVTYWE